MVRYSYCCDRSRVVGFVVRFNVSMIVEFDKVWVIVVYLENVLQVSGFVR